MTLVMYHPERDEICLFEHPSLRDQFYFLGLCNLDELIEHDWEVIGEL